MAQENGQWNTKGGHQAALKIFIENAYYIERILNKTRCYFFKFSKRSFYEKIDCLLFCINAVFRRT